MAVTFYPCLIIEALSTDAKPLVDASGKPLVHALWCLKEMDTGNCFFNKNIGGVCTWISAGAGFNFTLPERSGIVTTPLTGTVGIAQVTFSLPLLTLYCVTFGVQLGPVDAQAYFSNVTPTGFTITTKELKPPNKIVGGITVSWHASVPHA